MSLTSAERRQLDENGFLALEGIISDRQIAAMRRRLDELLAGSEQRHAGTQIVGGLFEEAVFDAAWTHPRIQAGMELVLRDSYRLMGVSSRGIRPGHGLQALHVDWGGQGTPGVWYCCHAICPLVDFTRENGATRVLPGSHRNPWMTKAAETCAKNIQPNSS